MKIRIDVEENIPKHIHNVIAKKCLHEFCEYTEPIIGVVVGRNRTIENIKYEFSMHINKSNSVVIYIYLKEGG